MSVRDLDEMRAFKKSEARLIIRGKDGSTIDKIICDIGLKELRRAHAAYIKGDAVLQGVMLPPVLGYSNLVMESTARQEWTPNLPL